MKAFTTGAVVQVFLLSGRVPAESRAVPLRKNEQEREMIMLVLSRKNQESVVVGGTDRCERLLKVTVLEIRGGRVRLGFDVDSDVPVHRFEVWQRIHAATRRASSSEVETMPVRV